MAGLKEIAILFRTATRLWRPSNCAADATSLFALFFFFINREHLVLLSIRWFSRYFYNLHPHKRIYPLTMNNTSYAEESRIKYRKYKGHIWILQKDDRNGQKCHLTVRHTQKTPILIGLLLVKHGLFRSNIHSSTFLWRNSTEQNHMIVGWSYFWYNTWFNSHIWSLGLVSKDRQRK